MCRLLGYTSLTATTLEQLIGLQQCSTFQDMSSLHADGWGTAWLRTDDGENRVIERARETIPPRNDSPLMGAMTHEDSLARIIHLRMATTGLPVNAENTHPFISGNLAFAHNGSVTPIPLLREKLEPEILASVTGGTDSELYFALIRQYQAHGLSLFDATSAAVSELRVTFPKSSLNALLLSPEELIVVHSSENAKSPREEFTARGLTTADLPLNHLDGYYQMSYLRTDDGATVFSSAGIDTTGWTPLPPATVTSVQLATGELSTRDLIASPLRSIA